MKVYDLMDAQDRAVAFEVDNGALGRRALCDVVRRIPGANLVRRPVLLSWFRESTFCEFDLDGVRFSADEEPWGDSTRYWIGPDPPRWVPQIARVRRAFSDRLGPPVWFRAMIVSLFLILLGVALLLREAP